MAGGMRASSVDSPPVELLSIPVLDLSLMAKEGGSSVLAKELGSALENVGFFCLTNHGVPQELLDRVFGFNKQFHALPLEEKMRVALDENRTGYDPSCNVVAGMSKQGGNAAIFFRLPDPEGTRNQ